MILLLDIGNTHVHAGLASGRRLLRRMDMPTPSLWQAAGRTKLRRFVRGSPLEGWVVCSVVPRATPVARNLVRSLWSIPSLQVSAKTIRGLGIDYPRPETIGADRLANALAAKTLFGAPTVAVDFGTAVTFDVVDRRGAYVGGIIAPGLAAMSSYLHEKTALLPTLRIRAVHGVIGKSTEEAMLIGAVHGYRGLVRELLNELKAVLACPQLPVVATGGYARLIAAGLPEITRVVPGLTLEGLRLCWRLHQPGGQAKG